MKDLINLFNCLSNKLISYGKNKPEKCIFNSISDLYYRENFHSDVIAYYLSYDLPKKCLISWLNEQLKAKNETEEIVYSEYEYSTPIREEGRRDITIYSQDHKRAIFIENKSNDAEDMDQQVYRYYMDLIKNNVSVDAVVYLNKKTLKEPSYTGWKNEDIDEIKALLLVTTLTGPNSFTDKIINEVIKESNDIRLTAFSMELKTLFKNIINGENIMSNSDFEEYMTLLNQDNNSDKMKRLVQLFNDLPNTMRDYYYEYLQGLRSDGIMPKTWKVGRYTRTCVFIDSIILGDINYVVDIWFSSDSIELVLHIRNTDVNVNEACDHIRQLIGNKWFFQKPAQEGSFYTFSSDKIFDQDGIKQLLRETVISFKDAIEAKH